VKNTHVSIEWSWIYFSINNTDKKISFKSNAVIIGCNVAIRKLGANKKGYGWGCGLNKSVQ